jgi:hypothetical protein
MQETETIPTTIQIAEKDLTDPQAFEQERRDISEQYADKRPIQELITRLSRAEQEARLREISEANEQSREDRAEWFTELTQLAVSEMAEKKGIVTDSMTLQEIAEAMAIGENDIPHRRQTWTSYDLQFGADGRVMEITKRINHPGKKPTLGTRRSLRAIPSGPAGNVRGHAPVYHSKKFN